MKSKCIKMSYLKYYNKMKAEKQAFDFLILNLKYRFELSYGGELCSYTFSGEFGSFFVSLLFGLSGFFLGFLLGSNSVLLFLISII
jgi:hypothetical protein